MRLYFASNGILWRHNWKFYGVPIIQKHRRSHMSFGPGLQLRSSVRSNPLGANHPVMFATWQAGAILEVGANFGMTGGTICVAERITIGDNVTVGANVTIIDTDFHPLNSDARRLGDEGAKSSPVVIENDVFIGMNSLVLKGVIIGEGSVVGAGSVLTQSVPAHVVVAGNPARVVRNL